MSTQWMIMTELPDIVLVINRKIRHGSIDIENRFFTYTDLQHFNSDCETHTKFSGLYEDITSEIFNDKNES